MRLRSLGATLTVMILAIGTSRADFKYTQQSKITGGALVGMTKTLGVFSKSARQATEPQLTTTMVHGNRMRTEQAANGTIEIIDLDGKRFIHIDTAKKSYWIQTFEQFRQQMEQAQAKMKEEEAKNAAKHGDAQSVTIVPKVDVQATGQTRTIMNISSKEMKMRVDMLMKSTDPKTEADLEKSNASFWMTGDGWYGPVPGYDEVRQFYVKMAKELDWLPGSMGMTSPQMKQAGEEFRKNSLQMDGMPLVQFTSFGMAASSQEGQSGNTQASTTQSSQQPSQSSASDNSTPTNPREAIGKSLGGLFGKKKKQQQQNDSGTSTAANTTSSGVPQPAPAPGSMMDVMTEVTSYSTDSLDASLFDVPAGYTQVQPENVH